MRARLLEAAVEILAKEGFAHTTTVAVCERTGTPRGTMLHHFPSRAALLTSAIDHVLQLRLEEFKERVAKLDAREKTVVAAVDALWASVRTPTFYAGLELVVAARTDQELQKAFVPVMRAFDRRVADTFHSLFPGIPDPEGLSAFALSLLNGVAIDVTCRSPARVRGVVNALKVLAAQIDAARESRG
jgi:AcrR family transcriptional regulator